jgi:hypothetical protein
MDIEGGGVDMGFLSREWGRPPRAGDLADGDLADICDDTGGVGDDDGALEMAGMPPRKPGGGKRPPGLPSCPAIDTAGRPPWNPMCPPGNPGGGGPAYG